MNDNLHISQAGLSLIKSFEGLYTHAYYDSVHVLTIGYGHTNMDGVPPRVVPGMTITATEALEILQRSLALHYEVSVKRFVAVPLSQSEFDALVSFCYNCGERNLKRLVRRLNSGDYNSIPSMMMQYTRAGGRVLNGLVRRREAEAALWRSEPAPVIQRLVSAHVDAVADETPSVFPTAPDGVPVIASAMPQNVDRAEELPDKLAKWGYAASPFTMIFGYMTDWRILAVLCVTLLIATGAYFLWRWKVRK